MIVSMRVCEVSEACAIGSEASHLANLETAADAGAPMHRPILPPGRSPPASGDWDKYLDVRVVAVAIVQHVMSLK